MDIDMTDERYYNLNQRKDHTMTERELFQKYCPLLKEDEHEPFHITGIGCRLFTESGKSPTSNYRIELPDKGCKAIEYAFFWDYDIQHLYDLEHAFIYLDKENRITDLISSFHGRFYRQSDISFEGARPVLYIQPGKHALMAHPEYFRLFPDLESACNVKAGADGVAVPDMIKGIVHDKTDDARTEAYIKERFSFTPSGAYKTATDPRGLIQSPESLLSFVKSSVERELGIIRESTRRSYL